MGTVYALREKYSNQYRYVGCTESQPYERISAHLSPSSKFNPELTEWLARVGKARVMGVVLEAALPWTSLLSKESQWIERLLREGHPLLNRARLHAKSDSRVRVLKAVEDKLTEMEAAR